jgi:hypothetical protein
MTMTKTWGARGGAGVSVGEGGGEGVSGCPLSDGDGVVTVTAGGDVHDTASAMSRASVGKARIAMTILAG